MNLVLLDLDKTLVDANYQLTVPEGEFRAAVQTLTENGIRVGLCSDSTVLSLQQWSRRLGLTGPIIAERGAIVWDPELGIREIIDVSATGWLQDLRSIFLSEVTRHFPEATLVIGDATEFVRQNSFFPSMTEQVLVVNAFRLASFSFFARHFSQSSSELMHDAILLKEVATFTEKLVVSLGRRKEDLFWDESPEYAVLIVHARTTEKQCGVRFLANRYSPQKIVMIGDSMADYLNLAGVIQFAVGNASPEYKARCKFISKQPYTSGVIEGLKQLV